jgi:hypothetical protein
MASRIKVLPSPLNIKYQFSGVFLDDSDDDNDGLSDTEDYDDDGDGIVDTEDEDHPDHDDENDEL